MTGFHVLDLNTLGLLQTALPVIELDAVNRVNTRTPWRFWSYKALAGLAGERKDWEYPGRIRVSLCGGEARGWIRNTYRLWWTADPKYSGGLMFTANPRLGLAWDKKRIGQRVSRDAEYLANAARAALTMQPLFRPEYLELQRAAEKMAAASEKLLKVTGESNGEGQTQSKGGTGGQNKGGGGNRGLSEEPDGSKSRRRRPSASDRGAGSPEG